MCVCMCGCVCEQLTSMNNIIVMQIMYTGDNLSSERANCSFFKAAKFSKERA